MHIVEGQFSKVKLDVLNWMAVVHWPGALHEGNGTLQPFIDERGSREQRDVLLQILGGPAGGAYFEIIKSVVITVHEPKFVSIQFEFDKKNARPVSSTKTPTVPWRRWSKRSRAMSPESAGGTVLGRRSA